MLNLAFQFESHCQHQPVQAVKPKPVRTVQPSWHNIPFVEFSWTVFCPGCQWQLGWLHLASCVGLPKASAHMIVSHSQCILMYSHCYDSTYHVGLSHYALHLLPHQCSYRTILTSKPFIAHVASMHMCSQLHKWTRWNFCWRYKTILHLWPLFCVSAACIHTCYGTFLGQLLIASVGSWYLGNNHTTAGRYVFYMLCPQLAIRLFLHKCQLCYICHSVVLLMDEVRMRWATNNVLNGV
jgi:hypothetical protein